MVEKIAFDKASVRRFDENGFMHIEVSPISKEAVNGYFGSDIPGYEEQGLDPTKIYQGYRKAEEIIKGAETFNGLPLLIDHIVDSADNPQKDYRVGSLGTDAKFEDPYLTNSIIVTDKKAINAITKGTLAGLSAAYKYVPIFETGEFNGVKYDFIMTEIRGNHVALVEESRAGPDVVVADRNSVSVRGLIVDFKNKLKRILAMDADPAIEKTEVDLAKSILAVNELEAEEEKMDKEEIGLDEDKTDKIKDILKKYFENASEDEIAEITMALRGLAGDEAEKDEDEKAACDSDEKTAEDEDEKSACDEDEKTAADEDDKKDVSHALDSIKKLAKNHAIKEIRALHDAARDVRHILGNSLDVMAFDSANSIYKKALEISGVDTSKHDPRAWKSMVSMIGTHQSSQMKPAFAMDSKNSPTFKFLNRIRVEG